MHDLFFWMVIIGFSLGGIADYMIRTYFTPSEGD